jgi:hypothetical protein
MALTVTKMTESSGNRLPDPNPEMSVEDVKALCRPISRTGDGRCERAEVPGIKCGTS